MSAPPEPSVDPHPTLRFRPTSGHIGAALEIDLEHLLDDADAAAELRRGLHEHLVLVFPRLDPTPAQHLALARIFGAPQPTESYNVSHRDHDEITVFDSAGGYRADEWHADASWRAEVPLGATLCLRTCPPAGGDTVFANCAAAYDALSTGMKQLLRGRRALHEIGPDSRHEHPVVIEHPVTGAPVLFVNRLFTRSITNLPRDEAEVILAFLVRHVTRPEFTYRHRWHPGDVLVWDNWATQHYALFDYAEQRVADRIAFRGRPLVAAR